MLHSIVSKIDKKVGFETASAHCDIPCKIYDPSTAQIAALTIVRLVDLLLEIDQKSELSLNDKAQFARLVAEKEEHGLRVKEEVRVIWGDYFKQPQFEQIPEAHSLVHSIMLGASKAKQHVDRDAAVDLVDLVNQFAEAFWQTKGVATYRATCPYPPSLEVVYPELK